MMNSTNDEQAGLVDYLKAIPQYFLPHRFLSSIMFKLARSTNPGFKNWLINFVVKKFDVDMNEALESDPTAYETFNQFFTRALKPGIRPLCNETNGIACPVDGTISQAGDIREGRIFQAKGRHFTLKQLLGGSEKWTDVFSDGKFATIYLSPRDYHRIHSPIDGTLEEMIHVPGRLFSVSPATTRAVPGLFARNERVVNIFDSEFGKVAVILVGAIFVSSIDTVWAGTITPPYGSKVRNWKYDENPFSLGKGDELGRFNYGSTVILLFEKQKIDWLPTAVAGQHVQMGQLLANRT